MTLALMESMNDDTKFQLSFWLILQTDVVNKELYIRLLVVIMITGVTVTEINMHECAKFM